MVFASFGGDQPEGLYRTGSDSERPLAAFPLPGEEEDFTADLAQWARGDGFDADARSAAVSYISGEDARRVFVFTLGEEDLETAPSFAVASGKVYVAQGGGTEILTFYNLNPRQGDPARVELLCDGDVCPLDGALGAGQLVSAHVTRLGDVIIELRDDEISRIYKASRDGATWTATELYNRLGEDNGPIAVSPDAIVFADVRLAQQQEIIRIRIADGSLDRLTTNDASQRHPAVNDVGIYWVDERYTATASGDRVAPPALTHRLYRR